MIRRFPLFALLTAFVFLISPLSGNEPLPTNITVFSSDDFLGRNFFSAADALEGLTSVNLERTGYRGTRTLVRMRGGSKSGYVQILLDGRPINDEYGSDVDLTQIPINIVQQLIVTRGGGSLAHGAEAISGTIHIITGRPQQKGLESYIGTGIARDGVNDFDGRFFGRSNLGDLSIVTSLEESGGFMRNEESEMKNYYGKIARSFGGKGYWGGEYYYHDARVGLPKGSPITLGDWNGNVEQLPADDRASYTERTQHARLDFASPEIWGGNFYANLTRGMRDSDDRESRDGTSLEHHEIKTTLVDAKFQRDGLEVGAEHKEVRHFLYPLPSQKTHQDGIYAFNKWNDQKWTLVPGLRYDAHSQSDSMLSPRLLAIFELGDQSSLSSTIQRQFRVPSFDELYFAGAPLANPNLEAEKAWSYDLGAQFTSESSHTFRVTGFHTQIKDLIRPDATSGQYSNEGEETNQGVEIETQLETGRDSKFARLTWYVNWTTLDSERTNAVGGGEVESAMTPRNQGVFRIDQHLPYKITLSNEVRYQSSQFEFDNKQGVEIPSYSVWNIRFRIKILAADIYFDIENVTKRRYADSVSVYTPPLGSPTSLLSPQPERTYWTGIIVRLIN